MREDIPRTIEMLLSRQKRQVFVFDGISI